MRRGWNGITISRDTIHIDGLKLGFEKPVLFERHAVGGEYAAGWGGVGPGRVTTLFHPEDGSPTSIIDNRCGLTTDGGVPNTPPDMDACWRCRRHRRRSTGS